MPGERSGRHMLTAAGMTVVGLVFNLIGVLMLFRYGMPFRLSTGTGGYVITTEGMDEADIKLDARYRALGYVGLGLVVVGTAFQVYGTVASAA